MKISLTGPPRSGKTTIVTKAVELLSKKGCIIRGFYTPEVREKGSRIGFKIRSINGEEIFLARKDVPTSIRYGKYYINPNAGYFLVNQIIDINNVDFIVMDEIGPMELVFTEFNDNLIKSLPKMRNYILVFHRKLSITHPEIYSLIKSSSLSYWVTEKNRSNVWLDIKRKLEKITCK